LKKQISFIFLAIVLFITTSCQMRQEKIKRILDNPIVKEEKNVYDHSNMEKDLIALVEKYPSKMELLTLGKSVEGRILYGAKLGNGSKQLLVSAGFHGREWMTSYLIVNFIELYLRYGEENKKLDGYDVGKLMKETTLYFVPMVNPDGIDLVLNGVGDRDRTRLVEMNEGSEDFSRWKANINGVDPNRQFNADWEETDSKENPSFENYKGSAPLNQPESKYLENFTLKINPDIVLAYHLSGSVIFWFYNQTKDQYKRDYKLAKKIGKITGYKLVDETDSDNIAAGYKDWFVKDFQKPGYTIEIGDKKYDRIIMTDIDQYILENREVILYLGKYLINRMPT